MSIYSLQPNVRASIGEFISYAHTSVNEVRIFAKHHGWQPLLVAFLNKHHSFCLLFYTGECQVPTEWKALQLHHPEEFPGVYEAIWQLTGEKTYRAHPEDGEVREWPAETTNHCFTGQIMYTCWMLNTNLCHLFDYISLYSVFVIFIFFRWKIWKLS